MRSQFRGHFRPSDEELEALWHKCTFAVDANVLLNLYRYSDSTREELKSQIDKIKTRVFLPHQAANEFFSNRLSVTSSQIEEYPKAIQKLNDTLNALKRKNLHPFLPKENLHSFETATNDTIKSLEQRKEKLERSIHTDEVLSYLENRFKDCTGEPYKKDRLDELFSEANSRYDNKIPPGYLDKKKDNTGDLNRKFADFIIWMQVIDFAKKKKSDIIFITDDKKDDWWLQQSGRTFGPRPELIEEIYTLTKCKFWMYTVERFIETASKYSKGRIDPEIIQEIKTLEPLNIDESKAEPIPATIFLQEINDYNSERELGDISIFVNRPVPVATVSLLAKTLISPSSKIRLSLSSSPMKKTFFKVTSGIGIRNNFHVHISANSRENLLQEGEYVFEYEIENDI